MPLPASPPVHRLAWQQTPPDPTPPRRPRPPRRRDRADDWANDDPDQAGRPGRPQPTKPTDQLLVDRGGVLLPKGMLQVEPSVDYTHVSSDRVAISGFTIFDAIVIGSIRVDDLARDIATSALTLRYGVWDRWQVDVRVPAIYRRDKEIFSAGTSDAFERRIDGAGLGDLEATVSYQPLAQRGWWPALIVRARGRFPTGRNAFEIDREQVRRPNTDDIVPGETRLVDAPTGAGFYGASGGVTGVWRADPAVFFMGGSYTHNLARRFDDFGQIEPGNTYEGFAGLNLALSERVSFNVSFVNQVTRKTAQGGVSTPGSATNDARLLFGSSISLGPRTSVIVSASAGLTDEAPDFTFSVSIPLTFTLF
ncbi:hypothetical protein CCR85_10850 [Rhodothalassium salexigens]|uniref:hypothetical protein n=1 Tax=Rhodothalassium salexigens TaxID=1086 RepID=UPI001913EE5E|nr:hypothetical protein [Rhodothalassium salexigens]MBK5911987.1 hypothetical protein [Rhodothalassium salexigens]MBK5922151.1 hypothetical protein [Rhodothalassium salexigens]